MLDSEGPRCAYRVSLNGRQGQHGSKAAWLTCASETHDSIEQHPPRAGEGDAWPQATKAEGTLG